MLNRVSMGEFVLLFVYVKCDACLLIYQGKKVTLVYCGVGGLLYFMAQYRHNRQWFNALISSKFQIAFASAPS